MKNKIFKVFLLISIITMCISQVFAENILRYDPKGVSLEIEENLEDTFIGLSQNVTLKSAVNAVSILFGENTIIEGKTEYLLALASSVSIKGEVEKETFAAGRYININDTAKLGKNVYLIGDDLKIAGKIDKKLFVAGRKIKLDNVEILGDVYLSGEEVIIGDNVKINGKLTNYKDSKTAMIEISKNANIALREDVDRTILDKAINHREEAINVIYYFITSVFSSIIIFLIIYGVNKKAFSRNERESKNVGIMTSLMQVFMGTAILLIVPIVFLIALIAGVPILAFIILALYFVFICLSNIYFANYLAQIINNYRKNKKDSDIISITLLVILSLKILELLPYIGTTVSFISAATGMYLGVKSIINNEVKENIKTKEN